MAETLGEQTYLSDWLKYEHAGRSVTIGYEVREVEGGVEYGFHVGDSDLYIESSAHYLAGSSIDEAAPIVIERAKEAFDEALESA